MDRANGRGVGSGLTVLGTPGPEDEVLEAAARWCQAARLRQDVRFRAGSWKSRVLQDYPSTGPVGQEALSSSLTGVSLPWRSLVLVWVGLGGDHLLEVQLGGHSPLSAGPGL